jgi:hypothetical protein
MYGAVPRPKICHHAVFDGVEILIESFQPFAFAVECSEHFTVDVFRSEEWRLCQGVALVPFFFLEGRKQERIFETGPVHTFAKV